MNIKIQFQNDIFLSIHAQKIHNYLVYFEIEEHLFQYINVKYYEFGRESLGVRLVL